MKNSRKANALFPFKTGFNCASDRSPNAGFAGFPYFRLYFGKLWSCLRLDGTFLFVTGK